MKEEQFIAANSSVWKELELYSEKINKKGVKALSSKEIKNFLSDFRKSSHHLAYARTHYPKSSVVGYLNSLVGKCHNHIYAVKKVEPRKLLEYVLYGFPCLIKKYKWYLLFSFSVFLLGFFVSMALTFINPENAGFFLPSTFIDNIKNSKIGSNNWNYPLMSSYIMVNNISVSLKAFVLGITLGIGTFHVLFFNGALLGSLTALIYMYSSPVRFWSLILPHGIIELTAIFISGASGFLIAKHMLLPGEHFRLQSLVNGAKKAISLLGGVIIMLIIAGIIEGFFTPLNISDYTKLIFAAITAIALAIYFSIPFFIKNQNQ
ncbi:hypothetical protein Q428_05195 [Fervidicella metallireducens AeB]|uniref:Stage II sporulation protein M n=1 Tax=Fervidicella metallireducens AeB TaxID=1403537 RepID=A0A017RW96_9CLOT|nr:stage II sporulation protein M [Fervidicella metallireducens]EYE88947.1 hypothetical protein Q428_05195 [Fervidicella metallireducens AeB]